MTRYFAPLGITALLVLLMGCAEEAPPTPTAAVQAVITIAPPTRVPPATLVPTFTPVPEASPFPAEPAAGQPETIEPGEQPADSEDFSEIIVDLRYALPATGLARRLQGNRANRITFLDETSGVATAYSNQGGVLLELRQALSELSPEPVPADCDACVLIQYELSIEEIRGEGWLQDPVLLASIENFMSIALGPHFPPQTTVGLRRSASPYAPAHTLALTEAGELWTWLATDSRVASPTATVTDTQPLRNNLEALPMAEIDPNYVVACEGAPVETLYLSPGGEALSVSIVCPEYSLPSVLLPLYLQLNDELASILAGETLERPPAAFPLEALLDYRRFDGTRLTLYQDGQLQMLDSAAEPYTSTLSMSRVVSLTQSLWSSGMLEPGLGTFGVGATATITPGITAAEPAATSVMVLRGPDGLYDGEWNAEETPDLPILAEIDALLDVNLGLADANLPKDVATAEATQQAADDETTATPTTTATPASQATATPQE